MCAIRLVGIAVDQSYMPHRGIGLAVVEYASETWQSVIRFTWIIKSYADSPEMVSDNIGLYIGFPNGPWNYEHVRHGAGFKRIRCKWIKAFTLVASFHGLGKMYFRRT